MFSSIVFCRVDDLFFRLGRGRSKPEFHPAGLAVPGVSPGVFVDFVVVRFWRFAVFFLLSGLVGFPLPRFAPPLVSCFWVAEWGFFSATSCFLHLLLHLG